MVLAMIPYFKFHFFLHLLIFLDIQRPLLCTNLNTKSSPAENIKSAK